VIVAARRGAAAQRPAGEVGAGPALHGPTVRGRTLGYLNLPVSVVTVLLHRVAAAELVQARAPIVRSALPDRSSSKR